MLRWLCNLLAFKSTSFGVWLKYCHLQIAEEQSFEVDPCNYIIVQPLKLYSMHCEKQKYNNVISKVANIRLSSIFIYKKLL